MKNLFFLFIVLLFLFSCLGMAEPTDDTVGGVIGKIQVKVKGVWCYMDSGIYKNGLEITIRNQQTGKLYVTTTHDGYYYFLNLNPGMYQLIKYQIIRQSSDYRCTYTDRIMLECEVSSKNITTISNLEGYIELNTTEVIDSYVDTNEEDKDELQAYFQEQDKKGYWSDFTFE